MKNGAILFILFVNALQASDELSYLNNAINELKSRQYILQNKVGKYEDKDIVIYKYGHKYIQLNKNDSIYFQCNMPNENYDKYLLTYLLAGNYQKTILNSSMEIVSTYPESPSLVTGIAFQFKAFESIFNRDSNPHFIMHNK